MEITTQTIGPFIIGAPVLTYKDEILTNMPNNDAVMQGTFFVQFNLKKIGIILVFNLLENALAKISAYTGSNAHYQNSIRVGGKIGDLDISNSLIHDEDEDLYLLIGKNIALSLENPYQTISENPDNLIQEITVFKKELLYF